MGTYTGSSIGAPCDKLSEDVGAAVLIQVGGGHDSVWDADPAIEITSWAVLNGANQARVRTAGLVNLPGVCGDIQRARRAGETLLAGTVSQYGYLVAFTASEELGLAIQAAQAYGWG